jgi:hypothetical protein
MVVKELPGMCSRKMFFFVRLPFSGKENIELGEFWMDQNTSATTISWNDVAM